MKSTNVLAAFALFAVVALAGYVFTHQTQPSQSLGAAGQVHTQLEQFFGDLTIGGNIIASSTSANVTLKGTEFTNAKTLDYTVNVGSVTLTLPASTTPMCSSLTKNEQRIVLIRHATTTASSNLTLAGSASIILKSASSTKLVNGSTDGSPFIRLDIIKKANTDCVAMMIPFE